MALTNAEKQKRFRERQKQKAAARNTPVEPPIVRPFVDYINGDELKFEALDTAVDLLGGHTNLEEWIGRDDAIDQLKELVGGPYGGAIMAIATICGLVNEYKLEQIDAQILQIENADLSEPEAKAKALSDIVRLHDLKKQFSRKDRYEFANMEVVGEAIPG